jgi:hypothetical protein
MQLDSEVPAIERGEEIAVAWILHYERDVITNKRRVTYPPLRGAPIRREQTFPGSDVTAITHCCPPDNACITSMSEFG